MGQLEQFAWFQHTMLTHLHLCTSVAFPPPPPTSKSGTAFSCLYAKPSLVYSDLARQGGCDNAVKLAFGKLRQEDAMSEDSLGHIERNMGEGKGGGGQVNVDSDWILLTSFVNKLGKTQCLHPEGDESNEKEQNIQ